MKKLILILTFCIVPPALAQEDHSFVPIGTNWDNTAAKLSRHLKEESLSQMDIIKPGIVNVSIVHPDYLEPNQFGLLLTKSNSMTGCHEYSSLEYEAKYIEHHYMDIDVKHYRRTLKETQNPEYDCNTTSKIISSMIVFSADDLKNKNIKQIRFGNGAARDAYNVAFTENSVRLTPDSMVAFKAQDLKGADKNYIEYTYVDNSLLTLQVPMAQDGDDIAQAVRDLAYRSALTPVFELEGLDTSNENHVFYFTDPNGTTLEQIGTDGYAEFGTINVTRPYDGPNGRVGFPVPLKVFLARPNVTL